MIIRVSISDIGLDPAKARRVVSASLGLFASYFRKRIHYRYLAQGPGWAPNKDATAALAMRAAHVKNLTEHRLRRKLEKDLRRAQMRANTGKGSLVAIYRRKAVLDEFKRQQAGGVVDKAGKFTGSAADKKKNAAIAALSGKTKGDLRLQKSVAGLADRMQRQQAQVSSRILGRSESALTSKLGRNFYEVANRISWYMAQEAGGTVGHGAKIPARPAIYADETDLDVLQEILINKSLAALS